MSVPTSTDVLVVGGGPGGYPAAIRAAHRGARVTLVEPGPLGGVCLNEGCIPSKGLLDAAESLARAAALLGVPLDGDAAFRAARSRNDEAVGQLRSGIGGLLRAAGVTVVRGSAHFTGLGRVAVRGEEPVDSIAFTHAIVATGSEPAAVPGITGSGVVGAREVLELDAPPATVAVLGAGAVGLELACMLRRFGAEVTVIELLDQALPAVDQALVGHLLDGLRAEGVTVRLGHRAVARHGATVAVAAGEGPVEEVPAELVVVAAGRRPRTAALGTGAADVAVDRRGAIVVDDQHRTSNPAVFAVGDVTPGPGLAHRATAEGLRAADLATGASPAPRPLVVPSIVYTDPTLVAVGHTSASATAAGLDPVEHRVPLAANGRSVVSARGRGEAVVVAERGTDVVVGVHAVGHGVEGLAHTAVTAIELGALVEDLGAVIAPHPTVGEVLVEAAHLATGTPVHVVRPRARTATPQEI